MSEPLGSPLPVPGDFPVSWERPGDERLLWTLDAMHFPEPVAPLNADLGVGEAMGRAAEAYAMPVRFGRLCVRGYVYTATRPAAETPAELAALGAQTEERMREAMAGLLRRWDGEWLPELRGHLAHLEALDVAGAAAADLVHHLADALARYRRMWEIHFLIVFPAHLSTSLFADLYAELFAGGTALDADRLLRGRRHSLIAADLALWRLGRRAAAAEDVATALAAGTPAQVLAALEASPAGRSFRQGLAEFLATYGHRSDGLDLGLPTWVEDPTPALQRLRAHLAGPDRDLEADVAAGEAAAEHALADARRRLAGYPRPVVDRFESMLRIARDGAYLQEEHNFWIDLRALAALRRVVLGVGERLAAAGALARAADVFFLREAELRQALSPEAGLDLGPRVAARREELTAAGRVTPPPVLGTMPAGPPPPSPLGRALGRFFGDPVVPAAEPGVVTGHPASPGVARGIARIVRTRADADRLGSGEILVAPTTISSWTALFATAAAVVTDTGGMLSHAAVVAREYAIPAVVGAGSATRALRDGQTVEVDGTRGTVRIVG